MINIYKTAHYIFHFFIDKNGCLKSAPKTINRLNY